jgi:hypothetical protein
MHNMYLDERCQESYKSQEYSLVFQRLAADILNIPDALDYRSRSLNRSQVEVIRGDYVLLLLI